MRQSPENMSQEREPSPEEEKWNNRIYRAFVGCKLRGRAQEGEIENENIRKSNDLWEVDFKLHRLRASPDSFQKGETETDDEFLRRQEVLKTFKKLVKDLGLGKLTFEDLVKAQERGLIAQASDDLFWEEEYEGEEAREAA